MVGHFQEFEDEYLEMMYEFYEHDASIHVRTGALAEKLSVSPASVTEMLRRLASKGLVVYTPYKGAKLTDAGLEHGRRMKRRHRLAELLLDILPFTGDAHETACRLEHAIDDDLELCLSLLFSTISEDPSGREIPEPDEQILRRINETEQQYFLLSQAPQRRQCIISATFFLPQQAKILNEQGINIGRTLQRIGMSVQLDEGDSCELNHDISSKIVVKLVD